MKKALDSLQLDPTKVISGLLKACLSLTVQRLDEEKVVFQETCKESALIAYSWLGEAEGERYIKFKK